MSATFYQLVLFFVRPLVKLRLRLRARREPAYGERWEERFGHVPAGVACGPVWFHTVSAGETIAAAPLIRTLREDFPDLPFLVTTMTPTGSVQAVERLSDIADHCYAPYDFPEVVERFYARVAPKALVLMETELRPNLISMACARGIPVMLVNARLSERSARGYSRISGLVRKMLNSIDLIVCQAPAHRDRFIALGADPERVQVAGSVKFDQFLPDDFDVQLLSLRRRFGMDTDIPVWIAASTHPGEDEQVLTAHRMLCERFGEIRLVVVPRHPVRVNEVVALIENAGLTYSRQSDAGGDGQVVIGDVMGTLQYMYGLADVAFVGGSLVAVGGHNPIEPALCGLPVAVGPYQYNFAEVMEALSEAGSLVTVTDADDLAQVVGGWLEGEELRRRAGRAGLEVVAANRGAQEKVGRLIRDCVTAAVMK